MSNLNSHYKNLVSRERAEDILKAHIGKIKSSCLDGHAHFMEFAGKMPHLRFPLTARTVSGFINDWVVQEARINFASSKKVEIPSRWSKTLPSLSSEQPVNSCQAR